MHKDDFFLKLSWAFSGSGFDSIYDLEVPENVYTSLIYNTNYLCLNKAQFGVLMEFLKGQDKIFIAQNDSKEVFEFNCPVRYEDYESLDLFSMSYLSSSRFDWVVVIDEELESGIGFLIADSKTVKDFNAHYANELRDTNDMISFYFRDLIRNQHSIRDMVKFLSLLHTPSE